MRFLVDAQLPPAFADWLVERGYEAKAVRELGLRIGLFHGKSKSYQGLR